jgi:hypothetical protein
MPGIELWDENHLKLYCHGFNHTITAQQDCNKILPKSVRARQYHNIIKEQNNLSVNIMQTHWKETIQS